MALRSATICFADAMNVRSICSLTEPQIGRAEHQSTTPQRPAIAFNRWQEDWSVLADLRVLRQPFDEFKYMPLFGTDRYTYLSLGVDEVCVCGSRVTMLRASAPVVETNSMTICALAINYRPSCSFRPAMRPGEPC